MPPHLPTPEARAQGLPGSDVYRYSHLLYIDELHRDHGAVSLNVEALHAFKDTILIARNAELKSEQSKKSDWLAKGGFETGRDYPWGPASVKRMEYINYEHLKIACGFELHLKARLLARDVVIHEIDAKAPGCKDLGLKQVHRPVKRAELLRATNYMFDGKSNYLPGLKNGSLRFSWLIEKPEYASALELEAEVLAVIDEFRELRNQIHFPGDLLETPRIGALQQTIEEFLTKFLNSEVIDWSNSLIQAHKMNRRPIERLSDA
ncbi:MAG: hypothetical protein JWP79_106 [Polaromonas sp.]|nr:hypothetical protein [Polaromonas sp.]